MNRDDWCVIDLRDQRGRRLWVDRDFAEPAISDHIRDLNGLDDRGRARDIVRRVNRDRRMRCTCGDRDRVIVVQFDGDGRQRRILTDVRRVDNAFALRHRGRRAEGDHRIV